MLLLCTKKECTCAANSSEALKAESTVGKRAMLQPMSGIGNSTLHQTFCSKLLTNYYRKTSISYILCGNVYSFPDIMSRLGVIFRQDNRKSHGIVRRQHLSTKKINIIPFMPLKKWFLWHLPLALVLWIYWGWKITFCSGRLTWYSSLT